MGNEQLRQILAKLLLIYEASFLTYSAVLASVDSIRDLLVKKGVFTEDEFNANSNKNLIPYLPDGMSMIQLERKLNKIKRDLTAIQE